MQDVHALVPAAGAGTRFSGARDKLLVEVGGRTILEWTLGALLRWETIRSVTVAISPQLRETQEALAALPPPADERLHFVIGGERRQDSVARCLEACAAGQDDLVAVHDGGRPCLTARDLEAVVDAARRHGAAILGRPVHDTTKRVRDGWIEGTVDRNELFRAETPQVARRRDLELALERARVEGRTATDESELLEAIGVRVRAVEARSANPKVTVSADLQQIESILGRRPESGSTEATP